MSVAYVKFFDALAGNWAVTNIALLACVTAGKVDGQ
jgi:hypothetical protein